ncbi:hypothetical protein OM076_34160 [Solirubrobacter ginsenosidimutans]|uniref:Uncharacterized protein n=1 Tax=Solirubrobacter ginsenosidimutans TaxID=490573 RepID=A0A9X3MYZ8_9ACTN|nr:hypothetical protein [Solirubrobacter ginsenosidimutans]MDA0165364.1 hypothetical protein [Solirubrobacter ginsenosidimutans]
MDPTALIALARHGEEIATARAFLQKAHATRVVLLLHTPDGETAMLDSTPEGVEITEGDTVTQIPATAAVPVPPRALPEIRPTPATAIHIDTTTGELAAPLGTVDHLAEITLALAKAFGGLTVATAEFPTHDPSLPITFAAREGERVVLQAGDEQYEL